MLQQNETELFKSLTSGEFSNFALIEGEFRGMRAAFVACVNRDGQDFLITPLAVLLRDEDLEHCLGPGGEPLHEMI
jgi:hypothetical protein